MKVAKGDAAKAMQELVRFNRDSAGFHYRQRQLTADQETGQVNDQQAKVRFEDVSSADVRAYEPKIFTAFEQECQ